MLNLIDYKGGILHSVAYRLLRSEQPQTAAPFQFDFIFPFSDLGSPPKRLRFRKATLSVAALIWVPACFPLFVMLIRIMMGDSIPCPFRGSAHLSADPVQSWLHSLLRRRHQLHFWTVYTNQIRTKRTANSQYMQPTVRIR